MLKKFRGNRRENQYAVEMLRPWRELEGVLLLLLSSIILGSLNLKTLHEVFLKATTKMLLGKILRVNQVPMILVPRLAPGADLTSS